MKALSIKPGDRYENIYGAITVVELLPSIKIGGQMSRVAKCECHCGNIFTVKLSHLRNGNTKSCGCQKYGHRTTHGLCRSDAYSSWCAMKARCMNVNHAHYDNYGGRGIVICDQWMSFENFHKDMGERPIGTTLDRIESDGNYELSNCRWASWHTQRINRRS